MTTLRRTQTAVGVVVAALLVSLVLVPGLVPLPDPPAGVDLPARDEIGYAVAALLGLATAAFLLASRLQGSTTGGAVAPLVNDPPEEIHGRATGYPRPAVDETFEQLADGDATGETGASLSDALRETAVGLYAVESGCSRSEAADAIDAGRWTADRRAAVFVARDPDPLPFRSRLWDYVRPEDADHRRARHAVEALESLAAGERPSAPTEADR